MSQSTYFGRDQATYGGHQGGRVSLMQAKTKTKSGCPWKKWLATKFCNLKKKHCSAETTSGPIRCFQYFGNHPERKSSWPPEAQWPASFLSASERHGMQRYQLNKLLFLLTSLNCQFYHDPCNKFTNPILQNNSAGKWGNEIVSARGFSTNIIWPILSKTKRIAITSVLQWNLFFIIPKLVCEMCVVKWEHNQLLPLNKGNGVIALFILRLIVW